MKNLSVGIFYNNRLAYQSEPAAFVWILQRSFGEHPLHFNQRQWSERFVFVLADPLDSAIVIEDHPLVTVPWIPPSTQHVFGNSVNGRCAFELARSDCLFHKRTDDISIAQVCWNSLFAIKCKSPRELLVNKHQFTLYEIRHRVLERFPLVACERQVLIAKRSSKLDGEPEQLGVQPTVTSNKLDLVPMAVGFVRLTSGALILRVFERLPDNFSAAPSPDIKQVRGGVDFCQRVLSINDTQ